MNNIKIDETERPGICTKGSLKNFYRRHKILMENQLKYGKPNQPDLKWFGLRICCPVCNTNTELKREHNLGYRKILYCGCGYEYAIECCEYNPK